MFSTCQANNNNSCNYFRIMYYVDMATKISVDLEPEDRAALERIQSELTRKFGVDSISSAIRYALKKAAKGLPR